MHIFDTIIDRRNTNSAKWDSQGGDYIPMWVADMDFATPPPIIEAIQHRINHPVFGYTTPGESLHQAVINYYKKQYGYEIEKDWIVWMQGVNFGNNVACRTLGGGILLNTPMYAHINIKLGYESQKQVKRVPLKIENGRYTFDFPAMEEAVTKDTSTYILCNPHNPVGRVYTQQELEQLVDFALSHKITIVSDEIHSDLTLEGKHIPAFLINEKARDITIVHHSASKTYNIPGLPVSFAIIPNASLREAYKKTLSEMSSPLNALSLAAIEAAFTQCDEWRRELISYLKENQQYMESRIYNMAGLSVNHSEATYLAWIDARETGQQHPQSFFKKQANVHFNDGAEFNGPGFVRINFACPKSQLAEALEKVEEALDKNKR